MATCIVIYLKTLFVDACTYLKQFMKSFLMPKTLMCWKSQHADRFKFRSYTSIEKCTSNMSLFHKMEPVYSDTHSETSTDTAKGKEIEMYFCECCKLI